MKRIALFFMATLLAGCATAVTPRNDPPKLEFQTSRTLDDALACVVAHMTKSKLGYPFFGAIVVPNQSYEVRPGREIMVGGEPIFLKVEKTAEGPVVVKGYAIRNVGQNFTGLKEVCA
jgi:hypothetical protein